MQWQRWTFAIGLVLVGGVAAVLVVDAARAKVASQVYLDRLRETHARYEGLREQYNDAIRRTAVTELVVRDNKVTALIRTLDGTTREIPTSADPSREVYVDFAMLDGRVWIRRVFDSATRPSDATIIDPRLTHVDWPEGEPRAVGQAVYRTLGEGRWVVRVSGDGALGLAKVPDDAIISLAPPPELGSFEEVQARAEDEIEGVGFAEAVSRFLGIR